MNKKSLNKIIKVLEENNIIYFKRDIENGILLLLPYTFKNQNVRIDIEIQKIKDDDMFCLGFTSELKESIDFSKELLDLNSKLKNGRLSVRKDSCEVNFMTTFCISEDEEFSFDKYNEYINYCFAVYFDLLHKNILKSEPNDGQE